jgi:MFS transporter, CP family, cyanate transporter
VKKIDPALVVILAGVSAALHIGKLPPALPVLRDALQMSLVQAGFLLSLVQLAGMAMGLAMGAAADSFGGRRTMILGLLILSLASFLGGTVSSAEALLALRALEGLGFLLASLPAPGLIRRLVEPARLSASLGLWSAYMPFGTAVALLAGPWFIAATGWPGWWWLLAGMSLCMGAWMWRAVPPEVDQRTGAVVSNAATRIVRTLRAGGPWLASLAFACYSAQWLAVVGFLPTIYAQSGLPASYSALATALAAAVNIIGNVASGRLLQRGCRAPLLLEFGYLAMLAGAFIAFAPGVGTGAAASSLRYAGVLVFSAVGGLVPGTLFSLAVRVAPDDSTVSTTVGWMQQWSAFGQFVGPPVAAWVAARVGGWHATWWVTGGFALAGMAVGGGIARFLGGHPSHRPEAARSGP